MQSSKKMLQNWYFRGNGKVFTKTDVTGGDWSSFKGYSQLSHSWHILYLTGYTHFIARQNVESQCIKAVGSYAAAYRQCK